MSRTAWFRGEGGGLHLFDLPLNEIYAAQERQGRLIRVNPDGSAWSDAPEVESEQDRKAREDAADLERPIGPVKPSRADSKAQWVDYAELSSELAHDELTAMTKAALIERFG
jgi:hypothetical protein